jgi:hypothetical protein
MGFIELAVKALNMMRLSYVCDTLIGTNHRPARKHEDSGQK